MITEDQFQYQLGRMRDVWPKAYDNNQRVAMIWDVCRALEFGEFVEIVDLFIRSMRKPPMPLEFSEVVRSKKRYVSNNPTNVVEHECPNCGTLGIVRFKLDALDTLALCTCSWSKDQLWRLPKLSDNMKRLGKVEKCPLEWFKPVGGWNPEGVDEKVRSWGERVREAIRAWDEHGVIE